MAETTAHFDDAAAYERFMGRWSRAVGSPFLDWLAPPAGARWLEIGCGTGAFTEQVLNTCAPVAVCAVDPAQAQIDYVAGGPLAKRAEFRVADAQALPFPAATFDVVASALVINFIPDRPRALQEMRRVARPGGLVAGYVWDFAADRGPNEPLRAGLLKIGIDAPRQAGFEDSSLTALQLLFEKAGFVDIGARAFDVSRTFANFNDYWQAQTPPGHPVARKIAALPEADRARLMELVRAGQTAHHDGSIMCSARANAIKARVPD